MRTILIVDDEELVRTMLTKLLTHHGYRTVAGQSGEDGLRLARERPPDLIISDIDMPGIGGHEMLRRLQSEAATQAIPFIFLSGKMEREDVRLGMNLGADDYITKPFELQEILSAVRSRLARRDQLEERLEAKLGEFRNNLATNLPHEFRTPLAGILGYSEILLERPEEIGRDELRLAANSIHASGERLLRCVESFLLYAELESPYGPEDMAPHDASERQSADLIASLERAVTSRAKLHGRASDVRLSVEPAHVLMPEAYVQHALNEILDNAFRHSPRETPVEIACARTGETVTLTVTNRGRGLTAEQIERIGAFVQFDRKRYEQQGLGLGLAVSKRLVGRFGGKLEIESSPGAETTIVIVLPATDAEEGWGSAPGQAAA